jgi:YD repeat-containing protein
MSRDPWCRIIKQRLTNRLAGGASLATVAVAAFCPQPARAQAGVTVTAPPVFQQVDQNGVDLESGSVSIPLATISIGDGGPGSIGYSWSTLSLSQGDGVGGYIQITQKDSTNNSLSVVINGAAETFTGPPGAATFTQDQGRGSTLGFASGTGIYTYTGADGTVATFSENVVSGGPSSTEYLLSTLVYPAGQKLTYNYMTADYTLRGAQFTGFYLRSVASSLGYQLRFVRAPDGAGSAPVTQAVVFNMNSETCDPAAVSCTLVGAWPMIRYNPSTGDVTNADNQVIHQVVSAAQGMYTFPSGRQLTYVLSGGRVSGFSDGKSTWTYQYPSPANNATLIFGPENSAPRVVIWSTTSGLILSDSPNASQSYSTSYAYDSQNKLISLRKVSGSIISETRYTYDTRGNITETREISVTPGTPADIVTSASYPSTCVNPKTCNQPIYTIDARGGRTDYSHDNTHGGITSVTLPAGASGIRPQSRFSYAALAASYRNGSGVVISGTPVYLLTSTSECATMASCTGTADEIKTITTYGPNNGLLPVSVAKASGDGALSATTTTTYYGTGDVKTIDGPLPGSADTTRRYYDMSRRLTGEVGPDPDAGGTLLRRAIRNTYDADGRKTLSEVGTAAGQGDGDMATFQSFQQAVAVYDGQNNKIQDKVVIAGVTTQLQQLGYTPAGHLQCVAMRMNAAAFGSLPDACTQSAGAQDRIVKYSYDPLSRVSSVTQGVGTAQEKVGSIYTYTPFGDMASATDANGNLTTYTYDGFLRTQKRQYPDPLRPGTSSTSDLEVWTYNAAGDLTQFQQRDGAVMNTSHDALGNTISRYILQNGIVSEQKAFTFDNLSRIMSATDGGQSLSLSYDALGNVVRQTSSLGTVTSVYDPAGNRTRMVWPDGFSVDYTYNQATGWLTKVGETGQNSGPGLLATYGYDALGRRTSVVRGDGTATTYQFDTAQRLSQINLDLAGTSQDDVRSFTYNSAGQVTSRASTNNLYSWNGAYNVSRGYSVNGKNQVTSSGGVSYSYDLHGNLTGSGADIFQYDRDNRMTMATTGGVTTSFTYDALNRITQVVSGGATTKFLYDGDDLIAEYGVSGNLLRRYVQGQQIDDPIEWYEGTGTAIVIR